MPVSQLHTPYEVTHGAVQIPQVMSLSMSPEDQLSAEAVSGEVFARFIALVGQAPTTGFDTTAVASALATCGLTGSNIGGLGAGLGFYAQKYAEGARRAGAASHRKMLISDGIVVPSNLNVAHQGNATLTYQVAITYDGSNNPIVLSENQSLPAAATTRALHTIGPFTLAGVLLTQISNLSIDLGVAIKTEGSDSDIWPTYASIETIVPRIRVQGSDIQWWIDSGGLPLTGGTPVHADSSFYLRKRSRTGFVANNVAEHIRGTFRGLAHHTQLFGAQAGDKAESAIEIVCEYDGSNNPITFDTTSTIT